LAYKRGGQSPTARDKGRRTVITHTLSALSTILALASINTSGTWRPGLLSHHACSPPLRAPRCEAIQCPEHTTVGRTAAGTRINPASLVASTGPSRGRSQRLLLVSVGTTFRTDNKFIYVHAFGSVVFMQENMDIKDRFTTSSKDHLRSLVHVHELDEITSNGGKDRSAT
jgi:hypothetical protein